MVILGTTTDRLSSTIDHGILILVMLGGAVGGMTTMTRMTTRQINDLLAQ